MDFHLSFPTLKHLTMVCIGKVTLDKEIRPLKKLLEVDDDNNKIYTFEVEKIVTPLEIPAAVKHDLSDVITGMFRQVEGSLLLYDCEEYEYHEHLEQRKLLYDVHGKLDLPTIWKRFFDSEVSQLDALKPLVDLLNIAIEEELWYGLDAIVSKILSVACRDTDASFEKRQLVRCTSSEIFAFVYRFRKSETDVTRCLALFQLGSLFCSHKYVSVNNKALFVCLPHGSQNRLRLQFYIDYFLRIAEEGGEMFMIDLLLFHNSEGIIDLFERLTPEKQLPWFTFISTFQETESLQGHKNMFYTMLSTFLQWPLTKFFLPFLKIALPNLITHDVLVLFSAIQRRIPERGRFGVLYADMLVKYWQAIPPKVKEEFKVHGCNYCNMDGRDHMAVLMQDMGKLAKKNGYLSEKILTEMRMMD